MIDREDIKQQRKNWLANLADIGKVGVLYGGVSNEREVSLRSGKAVFDALIASGIDAELCDVSTEVISVLIKKPFDFAFIVLHGTGGEDGKIQAILDWIGIPYTGSGVEASAIAMDKVKTKKIWQASGLPVIKELILTENFDTKLVADKLGFPIAVKPALEGSSIGVSKVSNIEQLKSAYELAANIHSHNLKSDLKNNENKITSKNSGIYFDSRVEVMAEKWIDGVELTGAILADCVLPIIEITMNNGFYDYEAKYVTGATEYKCPSGLSIEKESEVAKIMLAAARAVGIKDWARVDAILDKNGEVWLLEINTIPGMTETSLVPKAAKAVGYDFSDVVLKILSTAKESYHA